MMESSNLFCASTKMGSQDLGMKEFINNPLFSDVTFVVENQEIYAHRIVLSAQSDFFKTELLLDGTLNRKSVFPFKHSSYDDFLILLHYFYTGKLERLSTESALSLLNVAGSLNMATNLGEALTDYLFKGMDRQLCNRALAVCFPFLKIDGDHKWSGIIGDLEDFERKLRNKICQTRRCNKPTVTRNSFCTEHGGIKKCRVVGCSSIQLKFGFCDKHRHRNCSVDGCDKYSHSKGLCANHGKKKKCSTYLCEKLVVKRGLCAVHAVERRCTHEGCKNHLGDHGACPIHDVGRGLKLLKEPPFHSGRCRNPDCSNPSVYVGSFCIVHGGTRECMMEECDQVAVKGGLCVSHLSNRQCGVNDCPRHLGRHGACPLHDIGKQIKKINFSKSRIASKICESPECHNVCAPNRNQCRSHIGGRKICSEEGCFNFVFSRGQCRKHGGGKICGKDGCCTIAKSGGFCILHGGGQRCKSGDCTKLRKIAGFCIAHSGNLRCQYTSCRGQALSNGFCFQHADVDFDKRIEHRSFIEAMPHFPVGAI